LGRLGWLPAGVSYCSACAAIGSSVLLIYGADVLPLIADRSSSCMATMNVLLIWEAVRL
jgi:hypothetical protein